MWQPFTFYCFFNTNIYEIAIFNDIIGIMLWGFEKISENYV